MAWSFSHLFSTLVRGFPTADLAKRGRRPRWPAITDNLDERTRDGIPEWAWADTADPRRWPAVRTNTPERASEPRASAQRTALDEYFAQAADDAGAGFDD
jgi:hypothetical protein